MELFFFLWKKNLTRCDIWKKLAFFLHPMQHLFTSKMNEKATILLWKYKNLTRCKMFVISATSMGCMLFTFQFIPQCKQTQIFNLFPQVTSNHEADFAFVLDEELKDGSFLLFHQNLWNASWNIFSRLKSYFLLILAPWQFFFVILESFFKREQSCNDFYLLQTLFIFQKGKNMKI